LTSDVVVDNVTSLMNEVMTMKDAMATTEPAKREVHESPVYDHSSYPQEQFLKKLFWSFAIS
jgi:hypothetical protein